MKAFVNALVEGDRVSFLYRDAAGVLRKESERAEYTSYHHRDDVDAGLRRSLTNDRNVMGIQEEGSFLRVRWRGRWERRDNCSTMRKQGWSVLESDVSPIRRIIADHRLEIAKPRRLYFDIETDSRVNFKDSRDGKARVLSWSAFDEQGNCYVAVLKEWTDAAEKRLLESFWQLANSFDQLLAWSGRHGTDTYDFLVMRLRSQLHGCLPAKAGIEQWLWLDHHDVYERMNKNAAESGAEKQSLKLQDVSMQLFGYGKDDFDSAKSFQAWEEAFGAGQTFDGVLKIPLGKLTANQVVDHPSISILTPLLRYNIKDVALMIDIEERTGYIGVFQAVCEACSIFPNTYALYPTVQMDGFMLQLGRQRDYHFPSKWYDKEEDDFVKEQFEGAFVLHPTMSGIVENVHVGDFASMYPSIIISLNMSPDTKLGTFAPEVQPANSCRAPMTGVCFDTSRQGILAFAVSELLRLRSYWRKLQSTLAPGSDEWVDAGRRSNAYKVVANSFFGAMGNKFSRYYDEEIAESITTTGRWLIQQTMGQAATDRWNITPIYGDTDALMAIGCDREKFVEFVEWCNTVHYPRILAEIGVKENKIAFENEKGYKRIVFIKNTEGKAAAKLYVGIYSYYKGTAADQSSKPEIKGLAWKRGDANLMARDLQWDLIEVFWKGQYRELQPYLDVVDRWCKHILNDPLTIEEVKVSQSISKKLEDYIQKVKKNGDLASQLAHVRVAHMLKERGQDVGEGTRIEYFMRDHATRDVRPVEDYQGDVDRFYLWEDKIFKPSLRLMEAIMPGHDWKKLRKVRPPKVRKSRAGPLLKRPPAPVAALESTPVEEIKPRRRRRCTPLGDENGTHTTT